MEIKIKVYGEDVTINHEQLKALDKARFILGRPWRAQLCEMWATGVYDRGLDEVRASLQQVRNCIGGGINLKKVMQKYDILVEADKGKDICGPCDCQECSQLVSTVKGAECNHSLVCA